MIRSHTVNGSNGRGRNGDRNNWSSSGSSSPEQPDNDDKYIGGTDLDKGLPELNGFGELDLSNQEDNLDSSVIKRAKRMPAKRSGSDEKSVKPVPINRLPPELLLFIFSKLTSPVDHFSCVLVCRKWADWCIELLWHRPYIMHWNSISIITRALNSENATYPYWTLIKRLNLNFLSDDVSDGTLEALSNCCRIERLTLTNCRLVTDIGLSSLLPINKGLLTLDLSHLKLITDHSMEIVAANCKRLQGLNIAGCELVTDASLKQVARNCRNLKRLKLNECTLVTDAAVLEFAENCHQLLEIDLHKCHMVTDASVLQLWLKLPHLRELRLAHCERLTDKSFLPLPNVHFENLRILDLTKCQRITDNAVHKIISVAPRLRNLVLAKCSNITDRAVDSITALGKNLHFLHLGHCSNLTDAAVKNLVRGCPRIRYIDLANCSRLTDASVAELGALPKLRRIGLVKCAEITDDAIRAIIRRASNPVCALERVHLSYCMNLTVECIHELLNACPKLTHLSLTGVTQFCENPELTQYCRQAPPEFNEMQQRLFCVFSGKGVSDLRKFLNERRRAPPRQPSYVQDGMVGWTPAAMGPGGHGVLMAPAPPGYPIVDEEGEEEAEE